MKLLNNPIDMIAIFDKDGKINPYKFKYNDKPIAVKKVMKSYEEKVAGSKRMVFVCMHDGKAIYELKYEFGNHKWFLYKK